MHSDAAWRLCSKKSVKILPSTEEIVSLSFIPLFLSLKQNKLICGTFDMRDINVVCKTIYGYSKIVQIPLSVWHASESWHNAAHCRRYNDRTIAAAISSSGRRSSPFPHFKAAINMTAGFVYVLTYRREAIHSSLQY